MVEYILVLILSYDLLCLGLSMFILFCSSHLLFQKRRISSNMSPPMKVYFYYVFGYSILSLIYYPYCLLFWRFDRVDYDARILFLFGSAPAILLSINPLMEFFLCLDRCIFICFLLKYTKSTQKLFAVISGFGTLSVIGLYVFMYQPYFPSTSTSKCRFSSCLITSNFLALLVKGILIGMSFAATLILAIILKYKLTTTNTSAKKINKTVLIIIGVTTAIELIPYIISQCFLSVGFF